MALHNGLITVLLRIMSSANFAHPLVIQPLNVLSFTSMDNSWIPILYSVMSPLLTMWIDFWTLVQINTLHLLLRLWLGLNPILVMISCMLVMVKPFPYLILGILHYIPHNSLLPYLMFSMYLILQNHYFLFKNFVVIIMYILNFSHLCFMLRISLPRQCSFSVRVTMVSMFCLSLLPRQFLRLTSLFVSLLLLISDIVDWVIFFPVFLIF
jgi:hypothetical protein